jgi:2-polyprenyl-6-methoxyphenol hydroxylase-like FAD-dependent oxidoreductase
MNPGQHAQVLISGGSLGGLMAANLLLRAGVEVLVLEKSPVALDGRGAGIVTHPVLIQILADCGATIDRTLGVQVQDRVVLEKEGRTSAKQAYPQILTAWGRLYSMLLQVLPAQKYVLGADVTHVTQTSIGTVAHCADGRKFSGDLLIGADGIRSVIRSQLAPQVQPVYAGYVAWRGVCDESLLSKNTLTSLFDYFGFCLPDREQMLGYPVAGSGNDTRVGFRRYNFVWYRPADALELKRLMTGSDGIAYEGGIPPSKIAPTIIEQVRAAADSLLSPQFAEVMQKTDQPFLQPIYDLAVEQLVYGRIALVGDAAFVARPHVGMGVTKAAQDAKALCEAIVQHGATCDALDAFETSRLKACTQVVERGRMLGAYLQSRDESSGMARSAKEVMTDTAIALA